MYLKECKSEYNRDICITMLITTLLTIAKPWNQPRCPSINDFKNVICTTRPQIYVGLLDLHSARLPILQAHQAPPLQAHQITTLLALCPVSPPGPCLPATCHRRAPNLPRRHRQTLLNVKGVTPEQLRL
jgi:hypothetical protein